MSDAKKEPKEETPAEGAEGAAPAKKSKKKLIIIGAVVLVLLLGGIAAALMMSGGGEEGEEAATEEEHGKEEKGHGKEEKKGGHGKEEKKGGHGKKEEKKGGHGGGKEGEEGAAEGKPVYYEMPPLIVNLNSPSPRPHFVNLKLVLEVADGDTSVIEEELPRIVDSFNTYIREVRREDLQGSAGLYRLEKELQIRLDKILGEGVVTDILFKEIIVQ